MIMTTTMMTGTSMLEFREGNNQIPRDDDDE